MINPLTIAELGGINTKENLLLYEAKQNRLALDLCIKEINDLLKMYWHKIGDKEPYTFPTNFRYYGRPTFDKAKELFLTVGFDLSYYPPHEMLSIKVIK